MIDEKQLVQKCIEQERSAQYKLYERFSGKLYALILRYIKDKDDAKDILQNTFIKIYNNLETFRFDCPLEAWMKRIAINTALKAIQSHKIMEDIDDVTHHYDLENHSQNMALEQLNLETLYACIDSLPEGCKVIFNLYAIEGYKHQEIAAMLGINEGTSKSQYARAKTLLIEKIEILQISR